MVTDFSGTSILSNEFVVIGRASTDNLGVLLGRPRAQVSKSGLMWSNVIISQVMATQKLAKYGRAASNQPKWLKVALSAVKPHFEPLLKKTLG